MGKGGMACALVAGHEAVACQTRTRELGVDNPRDHGLDRAA